MPETVSKLTMGKLQKHHQKTAGVLFFYMIHAAKQVVRSIFEHVRV